jgi:hypothetical protein
MVGQLQHTYKSKRWVDLKEEPYKKMTGYHLKKNNPFCQLTVLQGISLARKCIRLLYAANTLRFIPGNEYCILDETSKHKLEKEDFIISRENDRMGYRFSGGEPAIVKFKEMISTAVTRGSMQLLPDGQLIILMADHQTTGGYPRIGHIISADICSLAQMHAGDKFSLQQVTLAEAETCCINSKWICSNCKMPVTSTYKLIYKLIIMQTIDLNCDMGEGLSNDAMIMPWISSANIACGYHAGDEDTMKRTIELALQNKVSIGAHPGFPDKANFGRTEMQLPLKEVYELVAAQIFLLQKIANELGAKLHHVKPHGALYNMSAKDALLANTIAKTVYDIDNNYCCMV